MRSHTRILAGTALATLMAASVGAMADTRPDLSSEPALLLAQAEGEQPAEGQAPPPEEPQAPAPAQKAAPEPEQPQAEKPQAEQPTAQEPPPAEAAPAAEPASEPEQPKAEQPPAEEPPPEPEQPTAEQPQEPAAVAPAPAEPAPAEPAPQPEQPTAEQPPAQEPAPAEPATPAQPAPEAEQPKTAPAPAESAPAAPQPPANAQPETPAAPAQPEGAAPAEPKAPAAPAQPDGAAPPQPEGTAPAQPTEAAPAQPPADQTPVQGEAPNDGSAAPVLDSQKQQPAPPAEAQPTQPPATGEGQQTAEPPAAAAPAAPAGPPPANDKAAQEAVRPAEIQPVTAEQGKRRDRRQDDDEPRRRERPEGSEVLREIGDRVIIEFDNQVIVESNDRPRMSRGAREVYYEDLPRGRTRETIVRADGTRVVTVRNAYGDVIRRSRIAADDREYVLVYVEEDNYDRVRDWRDPGLDLPPLRLEIPEDEYILDAATAAEEPEAYYTFLEQPPVERVERLYSVDEVKRSARIRDKTRRVDLDTLTFEFGSAGIPEDQIARLDGVAQAMEKLLKKNPAETFLIEGHTDAVGSDLANLALSDRRAEAVADALTNVFAIPPENLATQGYGEQYLKVRTPSPERENRRVAIRRITPLIAPVASAQ